MTLTRRALLRTLLAPTPQHVATADPVLHFLHRSSYGPLPEEVAAVRRDGIPAYLDRQLNPAAIDDDAADAQLRLGAGLLLLDRPTLYRLRDGSWRVYQALADGFLIRAVHSRRQLLERMVDFWSDHFNIPADSNSIEVAIFQREVLRRHALGRFQDLLMATARSPAMLVYLDNYVNVRAHPNENYARELLELHTLGVDGGYTEADVVNVARAFTGWTTHDGTRSGFWFNAGEHDDGPKEVLGVRLPAGRGIDDGHHVLALLANHPATARFICSKLAVRFVGDDPPPALVDRLSAVWRQSGGDIPTVLRALFLDDAFYAAAGAKLRRPLEFLAGALRATGTRFTDHWAQETMLRDLGQYPYAWHPPNGYPDVAPAWISTNGLLARWNAAMSLTHGGLDDAQDLGWGIYSRLHDLLPPASTVGGLVDGVATRIWGAPLPADQRAPFVAYAADGGDVGTPLTPHLRARKLGTLFGLMLASPLYQWR